MNSEIRPKPLSPILAFNKLSFVRGQEPLFIGLNASFRRGQVIYLRGDNGCGKTTFLKILTGLLLPTRGQVVRSPEGCIYLGHDNALIPSMTVMDNLEQMRYWDSDLECVPDTHQERRSSSGAPNTICVSHAIVSLQGLVDELGLNDLANRPVSHLSAGQARRLAFARVLMSSAPIWLLDEPFSALDKRTCQWMNQHIARAQVMGKLVILTSHTPLDPTAYAFEIYEWDAPQKSSLMRQSPMTRESLC